MPKFLRLLAVLLPLATAAGRVSASPLPAFDLDAIAELPSPTSISPDIASSVIDVATAIQAALYPSLPSGNYLDTSLWPAGNFTTETFQSFAPYASAAAGAAAAGYTKAYTGLRSMRGDMPGVLRISTYATYDAAALGAKCDAMANCAGFGIWYERTPSVAPTPANPNPQPAVWVKVLFYAYPLSPAEATNDGQWSQRFWRSHAGVAFFNRDRLALKSVPGFSGPTILAGKIDVGDAETADNGGVSPLMVTGDPINGIPDPTVCKTLCEGYTASSDYVADVKSSCNMFNIFLLATNGQATGYQCQYYSRSYGADKATYTGGTDSRGRKVSIIGSWSYAADPQLVPYVRKETPPPPPPTPPAATELRDCGRKRIDKTAGPCAQTQDWAVDFSDDDDTTGYMEKWEYDPRPHPTGAWEAGTFNGWITINGPAFGGCEQVAGTFDAGIDRSYPPPPLDGAPHVLSCRAGTYLLSAGSYSYRPVGFSADLLSADFLQDGRIRAWTHDGDVSVFDVRRGRDVAFPSDWRRVYGFQLLTDMTFTNFKNRRYFNDWSAE
ncbi:uncharacterized protein PFL1_02699 [Pseudozyma flocculosa PF-1]|uniref:Uncharacterized protein n=1 Tax=Pseudozyma flocculosa PF-1 TaxID=1277687 RepID=A0A061HHD8_9BASI|nr:uncharacterized protein PFL1_02699 [Pseudozyma flocculosa PF-1]EPQ30026.1 hypothetical protein PFL1_02699 [Pseudozyma flocculosa PF-1]